MSNLTIVQTYYISTGAKNAMYTLRMHRDYVNCPDRMQKFMPDFYLCNLAATPEKAIAKASDYVERMRERIGERENFIINFEDSIDCELFKRRGKLSVWQTTCLEKIESGIFPFGKHKDTAIAEAPESYILYFADKEPNDIISGALSAACMGVALEKDYIKKREAKRQEIRDQNLLSNHVGSIGERKEFTGYLLCSIPKRENDPDFIDYYINKVAIGDNILVYIGKSLGNKGELVAFKATIKSHDIYQDIKTTRVNRPYFK